MVHLPARWFQLAAVISLGIGVAMVFVLDTVMHAGLSLWLHIPLTGLVLTLLAGSAIVTGVALVEYNARNQGAAE